MRILLIDQYAEMGGAQRCLVDTATGFAARGWQLHAAVPDGDLAETLRPLCSSIQTIPCGPLSSHRKTAGDAVKFAHQLRRQRAMIRALHREHRFDAIYVNGPRMMPGAALAFTGTAVVFHAHNAVTQTSAAALLRASIRISRATVLATSRFVAERLETAASKRLRVVPNGVRQCAGRDTTLRGYPTIGVLGRVAPEKGQLEFVRAAQIVSKLMPCRFVIAGGPMFRGEGYYAWVQRKSAEARVEMAGWVDAAEFLAGIDLLVVPSTAIDATPRVIPEAFSAGIPVIAYAAGGIPELIEHGATGLLVRERSAEALAAGIMKAVRAPERLRAIAQRARAAWRQRYTVERFQEDVCGVVLEAVDRQHQRKPLASAGRIAEA